MNVTVNGDTVRLDGPISVRELIATRAPMGKAVAVNGTVVPASAHETTMLAEGDRIEIVMAVAGG